jgi:hypothetical protein
LPAGGFKPPAPQRATIRPKSRAVYSIALLRGAAILRRRYLPAIQKAPTATMLSRDRTLIRLAWRVQMKRLFYGVAVSALILGTGGLAVACEQHAHSAALQNPAAATQAAANERGVVVAQQQEDQGTSGEDSKEEKSEESK